jgi:hypothetical protein
LKYTDDFFKVSNFMSKDVEFIKVINSKIYFKPKWSESLYVSKTTGKLVHFYEILINGKIPSIQSYNKFNILTNNEHYITYTVLEYRENNSLKNELLISNEQGYDFKTINKNLICFQGGCDFYPIKSF